MRNSSVTSAVCGGRGVVSRVRLSESLKMGRGVEFEDGARCRVSRWVRCKEFQV